MAAKPSVDPKWSINNVAEDNIEPTSAYKLGGIASGGVWGREFLNWQFYALSLWIDWVRSYAMDKDNNLSDLTNIATARTNLGLNDSGVTLGANIATADALKTPRTINTVSFNGTANIVVEPYVERDDSTNATRYVSFVDSSTAGHQRLNIDNGFTYNPSTGVLGASISGNAATATTLQTARTINGVSFDGTANITIPVSAFWPVGATYIQFPGQSAPAALFGGTWGLLFNTEGVFFRTEGGNALAFEGGIQADEFKTHTHAIRTWAQSGTDGNSRVSSYATGNWERTNAVTEFNGGVETRPRNRTIRVWLRTG